MHFQTIPPFLKYVESVRRRTNRIIRCIPEDKLEWTYKSGKFTFGDLIRHLATIERYMYAENAKFRPSAYPGCGRELADGYAAVMAFFNEKHAESIAIFETVTEADLQRKTVTPAGAELTLWKWLRAMIEHEIHHRGQIYMMLNMLDIETPQLYGLTA